MSEDYPIGIHVDTGYTVTSFWKSDQFKQVIREAVRAELHPEQKKATIAISSLWLRRTDENIVEVLIETNEGWYCVIDEPVEGVFSHIVEPQGMQRVRTAIDPETHTMTRYEIPLEPIE